MVNAFITGITGMVGSHLTDFLLKIQIGKFMVLLDGMNH
jgi:nucleoside-diphosphate-sugar epimerase